MPFILLIIGAALVISGIKGTQTTLGKQLQQDFTGPNNFIYWLIALGGIGSLGYVPQLEKFSRTFMALIIIVLFISDKGFFNKFNIAIKEGTTSPPASDSANYNIPQFSSDSLGNVFSGSNAGGSSDYGDYITYAEYAAEIAVLL